MAASTQPESVAAVTTIGNAIPASSAAVTSSIATSVVAPPPMTATTTTTAAAAAAAAAVSGMDPAAAENLLQFAASVPVPGMGLFSLARADFQIGMTWLDHNNLIHSCFSLKYKPRKTKTRFSVPSGIFVC